MSIVNKKERGPWVPYFDSSASSGSSGSSGYPLSGSFTYSPYFTPPTSIPPDWPGPRPPEPPPRPSALLQLLKRPPAISWEREPLYRGEEAVRIRAQYRLPSAFEDGPFPGAKEYELEVGGEWLRVERLLITTAPRVGKDPGITSKERYNVIVALLPGFYLIRLLSPGDSFPVMELTAYGPLPSLAEAEDLAVRLRGEP